MRLAGPWRYEVLARYKGAEAPLTGAATSGTARLPGDWSRELGAEFRGRVRYTRAFNQPTNLDPHEHVWLVIDGVDAAAAVVLNGQELGQTAGYARLFERDVTVIVERRNELVVDVELPPFTPKYEPVLRPGRERMPGGLVGEVRLEIRGEHFIDRLAVEVTESEDGEVMLRVSGRVVGPKRESPLLLVVSGWAGELLAVEVVASEKFDVAKPIERLSRMEPVGDGLPGLAKLLVRLIDGGTRVWEKSLETAHRAMRFEIVQNNETGMALLTINDEPIVLPLKRLATHRPPFLAPVPPLLVSERILRDEEYVELDRAGFCIVQVVLPDWSDEVCARLAHHPSIVAWAAPREWLQRGEGLNRALAWLAGSSRAWLARELVLAEG